jgi:hypothetical protein
MRLWRRHGFGVGEEGSGVGEEGFGFGEEAEGRAAAQKRVPLWFWD